MCLRYSFIFENIRISRTAGTGARFAFVAHTDKDPFKNRDLLLAMKYGIDRQKIVDAALRRTDGGFAPLFPFTPHRVGTRKMQRSEHAPARTMRQAHSRAARRPDR